MEELRILDVRCLKGDSAFLIDDGRTSILYDTGFGFTGYRVAENVKAALGDRGLDYIFLTHSHYDHAMGSACVRKVFPEAKTVAGRYAQYVFGRPGARKVMAELDRKYADACGAGPYDYPWEELRVDIVCDDGDEIRAGDMTFRVVELPGHTRCSVGFYCPERKLLLATETLGVYDGEGGVVPSYLVGYEMSLQSMDRVLSMDIDRMLTPHYGLLTHEQTQRFLADMKPAAEQMASAILSSLQAGMTDRQIIDSFKDRFWRGYIRQIYPIDAAVLNTSIMIELIRKELGSRI